MYLCSFLLACLGNVFPLSGADSEIWYNLQPKFIQIRDGQIDIPKFSHALSLLRDHKEILDERNYFLEVKYQLNDLKKDLQLKTLEGNPHSTVKKAGRNGSDTGKKGHYLRHHKQLGEMFPKQAEPKMFSGRVTNTTIQTNRKLQRKKSDEMHFKRTAGAKNNDPLQRITKQTGSHLMLVRKENDGGKRDTMLKSSKLSRRTRHPKEETRMVSHKVLPSSGRRKVVPLLADSRKPRSYEILPLINEGKIMNKTGMAANNRFRGSDLYIIEIRNFHQQHKPDRTREEISKQITLTLDGSRASHLTTYRETKVLQRRLRHGTPKGINPSHKGPKGTGFSKGAKTKLHLKAFPSRTEEETPIQVIPGNFGPSKNELSLDSTTKRQTTRRWRDREVMPTMLIQISKDFNTDTRKREQLESQSDGGKAKGLRSDYETQFIFPSKIKTFLKTEASGSSELNWASEDQIHLHTDTFMGQEKHISSTQKAPTTQMQILDITVPPPTNRDHMEIQTITGTASEGLHDNLFRPLEAINTGSTYCKLGYTEHGGVCKSLCDIDGFYCEHGAQCVIVENTGAMCRCQQTNYLCYSGDCCRPSLISIQLICVIGSCSVLLSVLMGSLPVLMRRMDVKAVSKSVRTSRLWISSLMPHISDSSSTNSNESNFTVSTDHDCPPDLSTFHYTKEVTCDSNIWKCERTRL